jgi:hypothetical protein
MADGLNVVSRLEDGLAIVTTDGYINNTAAEAIAVVCDEHLDAGARCSCLTSRVRASSRE